MKIANCLIVLLSFLTVSFSVYSQRDAEDNSELPKVISPPAESFAFAKHGDFNVNLFKGEANISIPLYEFKSAVLSVPISLSYNSSGLKVNEPASSVGLGWTLNAGGVLTRIVKGQPDFKRPRKLPANIRFFEPNTYRSDHRLADTILKQKFDTEPDIFYFNFLGRGGKFSFASDSQAIVSPFQKIKFFKNNLTEMTDENGIKYEFLQGENSWIEEECTLGSINPRDFTGLYPSTWYLTRIIHPSADTITFEYEDFTYKYSESNYQTDYVFTYGQSGCPVPNLNRRCESIRTVFGKRIQKIRSNRNNTFIEFVYDTAQRKDFYAMDTENEYKQNTLVKINVRNSSGIIYDINFSYNYFQDFSNNPDLTIRQKALFCRLKLLAVTEKGKPPYKFYYNEATNLPERLSFRQDHYGYYNAKGNHTLIPKSELLTYMGANRTPDSIAMKANILEKIIYPTGGSTKFVFEANVVKTRQQKFTTTTKIKTISVSPPKIYKIDSFIVKDSSHIFNYSFTVTYTTNDRGEVYLSGPNDKERGIFSASGVAVNQSINNLVPGKYYMEIQNPIDGDNETGTFKVHYVENRIDTIGYFNEVRGGLRIKKILNYTDSLGTYASGKRYEYNFPNTLDSSSLFDMRTFKYVSDFRKKSGTYNNNSDFTLCFYKVLSSNSVPALNNDYANFYGYRYVTEYNDTLGKQGKTTYKFSVQLKEMDFDSVGTSNHRFVDWGRGNLLERNDSIFNQANNNYSLVRSEINRYKAYYEADDFWRSELGIKYPNRHEVFIPAMQLRELTYGGNVGTIDNDPNSPYLTSYEYPRYEVENYIVTSGWFHKWKDVVTTYGQNGAGPQTLVTNYFYDNPDHVALTRTESFDSRGILVKSENKYPHDFRGTAPVYDSMVARNIIAPVILQKEFQSSTLLMQKKINYAMWHANTIINPGTVQSSQYNNPLQTDLTYDLYDNKGNILQFTSKAGIPYSFVWGYKQSYPVARITGATYSEVLAALSQSDQQLSYLQNLNDDLLIIELNKLRTNLKISKPLAEVSTYTYIPSVGLSSERDPNNNIIFYEYDPILRLKRIRDNNGHIIKEYDYQYTGGM